VLSRLAPISLGILLIAANCAGQQGAEQTVDCRPIPTINNGVCRGKEGKDCTQEEFRLSPKLCDAPDPQYTAEAAKDNVKGTVVLRYTLGVDGCARDIEVVRGLGQGLDQAAVSALERFRWQRRTKPTLATIEINFDPQTSSTRPLTGLKCSDSSPRSVGTKNTE